MSDSNKPRKAAEAEGSETHEQSSSCVHDRTGRRRFIRQGAAVLMAGSTLATHGGSYAVDCDRYRGEEKDTEAEGSDSDAGEAADPNRCGRRSTPAMLKKTPQYKRSPDTETAPSVRKIKT